MFEHATLTDDVANTFGADDWRRSEREMEGWAGLRTLLLADVFEGKGQAGFLALDDADLAKGAFSDDAQETEVVQVDWRVSMEGRARRETHAHWRRPPVSLGNCPLRGRKIRGGDRVAWEGVAG